jgi:ankyrin repeat protein
VVRQVSAVDDPARAVDVAEALVGGGADPGKAVHMPTKPHVHGATAVMAAAKAGQLELLRWLLERDPQHANAADARGDTPLHHAAVAPPRAATYGALSGLASFRAAQAGAERNVEMVKVLLRAGADIHATNGEGHHATAKAHRLPPSMRSKHGLQRLAAEL